MADRLTAGQGRVIRSTSDFVYSTIRQGILIHQLPAGARLVEAKLSKELNVSITPVREAFARLANQGLLTVFPYKGTYVTSMSKDHVSDVYFLRRHLECMAAERGFSKLTDKDIAYYEQLFERSDSAHDSKDLYEEIRCDILFHEYMFTLAGSAQLMEMWNIIKHRVEYIQTYSKPAAKARVSTRHQPIMEALRRRDQYQHVAEIIKHLNSNMDYLNFPDEADIHYE